MIYLGLATIFIMGIVIKNKFILSAVSYSDEFIDNIKIKRERRWVFFFLILCALVMGLRDSTVGEDTQRYMSYFNYVSSFPIDSIAIAAANTGLDVGYVALMKLISFIYDDYFFFQFTISIFICLGYAYYLLESRIDTSIGIATFLGGGLYFAAFNTTRQSCALTFLLVAWTLFQKRRYMKALIFIFIASSMHLSAIIFAIPVFVYILRKHNFIYWIVPCGVLIVFLFYNSILKILTSIFPQYSHITSNDNKYMKLGLSVIVWILVLAISMMILKRKRKYQLKERLFAVCAMLYPLLSSLGLVVNFFERLGFYFIPFVPVVIDCFGKKEFVSSRIIYRVLVCLFFIAWFVIASKSYPYEIVNLFGGA